MRLSKRPGLNSALLKNGLFVCRQDHAFPKNRPFCSTVVERWSRSSFPGDLDRLRLLPIVSISSMKTMQGFCLRLIEQIAPGCSGSFSICINSAPVSKRTELWLLPRQLSQAAFCRFPEVKPAESLSASSPRLRYFWGLCRKSIPFPKLSCFRFVLAYYVRKNVFCSDAA